MTMTLSPEDQKRLTMMHKLPNMVKIMRNTFVAEKKTALSFEKVIDRICHSHHGAFSFGKLSRRHYLFIECLSEKFTIYLGLQVK